MCTMDYPKFIVPNQKEESISIKRLSTNYTCISFQICGIFLEFEGSTIKSK